MFLTCLTHLEMKDADDVNFKSIQINGNQVTEIKTGARQLISAFPLRWPAFATRRRAGRNGPPPASPLLGFPGDSAAEPR